MNFRSVLRNWFGGEKPAVFAIQPEPERKPHELETTSQLLDRAAMDQVYLNCNVFFGMDGPRLQVGTAYDNNYGDCLAFSWNPADKDFWYVMHMSPARARLFANEILRRCEDKEATDPGMRRIDQWRGATPDPRPPKVKVSKA